jgi:hypothetical protein
MWEHRVPKEPALEEDHLAKTVAALERVAACCRQFSMPLHEVAGAVGVGDR